MGANKNPKMAKKDLQLNFFTHFQSEMKYEIMKYKIMKYEIMKYEIMKFFSPNGDFSNHIGSMECKGLITAKNSTLELKTGPIEVEIITKNDQI